MASTSNNTECTYGQWDKNLNDRVSKSVLVLSSLTGDTGGGNPAVARSPLPPPPRRRRQSRAATRTMAAGLRFSLVSPWGAVRMAKDHPDPSRRNLAGRQPTAGQRGEAAAGLEVVATEKEKRWGLTAAGMEGGSEDGDGEQDLVTPEVDPPLPRGQIWYGASSRRWRRYGARGWPTTVAAADCCGNRMHSRRRQRRGARGDGGGSGRTAARWLAIGSSGYCGCGGRRHGGGDRDYGGRRHGGLGQLAGGVLDDRT
uniref:Uncharacterized protein n=1 Tax=Oryza glumipatula TaxID=40148 RepID=A0A0E0AWN4_9ORYZ